MPPIQDHDSLALCSELQTAEASDSDGQSVRCLEPCAATPAHQRRDCYTVRTNYLDALSYQDVCPIVLPYGPLSSILPMLDACAGLLLTGGGFTIDPERFGQPYQATLPLKPHRTQAEWALFLQAFRAGMPILGICAGAQLINVALGGDLIQHLPSWCPQGICHQDTRHAITLVQGSHVACIADAAGSDRTGIVNSHHVQAVGRLGEGVVASAHAPDGVVEAIEVPEHPFCIGLQWHPEYVTWPALDLGLFAAFAGACRQFSSRRSGFPQSPPA